MLICNMFFSRGYCLVYVGLIAVRTAVCFITHFFRETNILKCKILRMSAHYSKDVQDLSGFLHICHIFILTLDRLCVKIDETAYQFPDIINPVVCMAKVNRIYPDL